MLQDNLPPLLEDKKPVRWEQSFSAFVRHDRTYIEHGGARRPQDQRDHTGTLELGADQDKVVELRVHHAKFFSEQSFTVFIERDGRRIEAGKATPHEDGKGYQWPLACRIEDGEVFVLQSDGPLVSGGGRQPGRKRAPKTQNKP